MERITVAVVNQMRAAICLVQLQRALKAVDLLAGNGVTCPEKKKGTFPSSKIKAINQYFHWVI